MTGDLPKLKIGCGIDFYKSIADSSINYTCGRVYSGKIMLCPTCQHNLDAVKKKAAAHHKIMDDAPMNAPDLWHYQKGARDAVLGLLPKEVREQNDC